MFFQKDDPSRGLKIAVIVLSVLLVLVVGASAGYFLFGINHIESTGKLIQNDTNQGIISDWNSDNSNAVSNISNDQQEEIVSGQVKWQSPTEISDSGIVKNNNPAFNIVKSSFYKVGTFINGKYKGGDLILMSATWEGPAPYPAYIRLAKVGDSLTLLANNSDQTNEVDQLASSLNVGLDRDYVISELNFPDSFTIEGGENSIFDKNGPGIKLTLDKYVNAFFSLNNLKKVFTDVSMGDVYTSISPNIVDIFGRDGFYLKALDGTVRAYSYKPYFLDETGVAGITWKNGVNNTNEYGYTKEGGCGSQNYINNVSGVWNKDSELEIVGKTWKTGQPIYGFKKELIDSHVAALSDLYDRYNNFRDKKISYSQFASDHPVFFWIDPFGRMIEFHNRKFLPMAECGKPVIYLYPQQKEIISVKLAPQGGFSYTEPVYDNGWVVEADTNSNLRELKSNKIYPYLFWEGRGGIYNAPDKGFVVQQKNVHQFLIDKLALVGLNKKETADFIEFWEPRMQGSPYYFVSFMGNQVMNQLAPLEINPKPDTIIRVLMDFRPLAQPIKVEGYNIKTPERKGFTVVEWGGVLR